MFSSSPRNQTNLQQYLNSNIDDQAVIPNGTSSANLQQRTKIYYSDKSESTVEDLMDETPSNYNI